MDHLVGDPVGVGDRHHTAVLLDRGGHHLPQALVLAEPAVFLPVKGGWGRRGATNVRLKVANSTTVRNAMVVAWRNAAPKRLAAKLETSEEDTAEGM